MKTFLIFHIVAYNNKIDLPNKQVDLTDKVILRLIDKDYSSALLRAQQIVERNTFFLAEVVEYEEKITKDENI